MISGAQNIFKIPELKRRILITFLFLAIYRIGVHIPTPGINGDALASFFAQAKGTLEIQVTDAPPEEEVTSIMVTVESVAVHKAVNAQEEAQPTATTTIASTPTATPTADDDSGWLTLNVLEGKETFDLLKVKGIEEVLSVTELEAGKYTQIRMTISKVQVSLGEGELQDATLPSGKLKFIHPFNIVAGETTALLFDFDAEKSVNVTGGNKIIVNPVIKISMSTPKTAEAKNTKTVNSAARQYGNKVKAADNSTSTNSSPKQSKNGAEDAAALTTTTTKLEGGKAGVEYSATLAALGGTPPYTWGIDSGDLPDGLTLDSETGVISGSPASKGNYSFTAEVSDSATPANSDTQQLRIVVAKN